VALYHRVGCDPTSYLSSVCLVGDRLRDTIGEGSIGNSWVVAIAGVVVLGLGVLLAENIDESVQGTPTIVTYAASGERLVQWNSTLVEDEVNIGGWLASDVRVSGVSGRVQWLRGVNNLNIKTSTEGLHMRHDEGVINDVGRRKVGVELSESHSSQYAHDIGVMGEVKVQALVEGECAGHVVQGVI